MGNMNCAGQKANSKEWNDNFDRVFNQRPFFDVIDELDGILKETNEMEKLAIHICRECGEDGDTVCTEDEWDILWLGICDRCAYAQMKEESGDSRPYKMERGGKE